MMDACFKYSLNEMQKKNRMKLCPRELIAFKYSILSSLSNTVKHINFKNDKITFKNKEALEKRYNCKNK